MEDFLLILSNLSWLDSFGAMELGIVWEKYVESERSRKKNYARLYGVVAALGLDNPGSKGKRIAWTYLGMRMHEIRVPVFGIGWGRKKL